MADYGDIPGLTYGDVPGSTYGDAGLSYANVGLFPDVDPELIVTESIRAHTPAMVILEGVSTELPNPLPVPWCRVVLQPGSTQADGNHEDHRLLRYRLNVEVWARDKEAARDVMPRICDALLAIPGSHGDAGFVTASGLEGLPYWLPDPDDDFSRYLATVAIHVHANDSP